MKYLRRKEQKIEEKIIHFIGGLSCSHPLFPIDQGINRRADMGRSSGGIDERISNRERTPINQEHSTS